MHLSAPMSQAVGVTIPSRSKAAVKAYTRVSMRVLYLIKSPVI